MARPVRIDSNVQYRDLGDEAVLLHLTTGECFTLDEVANRVWQLLGKLGDLDRVAAALSSEYHVEANVLDAELSALVSELERRQLIESW
jgi:coenzyme PQQ synthesis protein D (PqqD)